MGLPAVGVIERKFSSALNRVRRHGARAAISHTFLYAIPRYLGIPWLCRAAPFVYVGPQYRLLGRYFLKLRGFRNTVSLRETFSDAAHGLTLGDYCHPAATKLPFVEQLAIAVAFVAEKADRREKVYIHCSDGMLRARVVAAAYLVYRGRHPEEALRCVRPGPGQADIVRRHLYEFRARFVE